MKKILTMLLVLVMLVSSLAVLTSCDNTQDATSPLVKAKEILHTMYKDTTETPKSYELVAQIQTPDGLFNVAWSENSENVSISEAKDGMVKVTITPDSEQDIAYTLTATITLVAAAEKESSFIDNATDAIVGAWDTVAGTVSGWFGGEAATEEVDSISVSFDRVIPKSIELGNEEPVAGTAYKFYLTQVTLGKNLYFAGKMSGEYLATTEDPALAPDVFVEEAEGGVRFYFMDGTAKKYIQIYKNSIDKIRPQIVDTPNMVFVYNSDVSVYFATIGETEYYLGTYSEFNTISASAASYITGANANKIGVSQFPCMFVKTDDLDIVEKTDAEKALYEKDSLEIPEEVKANSEITLPAVGSTYANATIVWALTEANAAAVIEDGKLKITLQSEATTVTLTATITVGEASESASFEIAVSAKPTVVPQVAENAVAGTAYKLAYFQTELGLHYYFDGSAGSYYGNMTDDLSAAVDVYKEDATGGYYIYFMNGDTKTYIEAYMSGTYCNIRLTPTTPESVWFDHADYKLPVVTLGEETYFLGTYGKNTDLRPSKISYIPEGNYTANFNVLVDLSTISPETKVEATKNELSLDESVITDKEIALPSAGAQYSDVAIAWALSEANAAAVIEDGKLKITLQEAATSITVVATVSCGDASETVSFTIAIAAKPAAGPETPVAGTAYKLYLTQVTISKTLYFNGKMDGKYLGSTEDAAISPDVFVEAAEGGVRFYFMDGTAKKYIEIYETTSGSEIKIYPRIADTASMVFVLDEGTGLYVANVTDKYGAAKYFLGTYSDYTTFSASSTYYITGDNEGDLGVSQFACQFVKTADLTIVPKTDAEKVAIEKDNLYIKDEEKENTEITLPAIGEEYVDVAIAWALSEANAAAVIEDGKLKITLQEAATSITVVATISCGEVSDTASFTIAIAAKPSEVITSVKFDFTSLEEKGKEITDMGAALELFKDASNAPSTLTAISLTKIYNGNGNGGAYEKTAGLLKTGTGSVAGQIVLTFTKNVSKVEILCQSWTATSSNTVNVNSGTAQAAPSTAFETLTFNLATASKEVTIDISKRIFIKEINITFAAEGGDTTTDADKVAAEKSALTMVNAVTENTEISLPSAGEEYSDVAIAWALSEANAAAVIEDGKLKITLQSEATSITVVATVSCGQASETVSFTIAVSAAPSTGPALINPVDPDGEQETPIIPADAE